MRVKKYVSFIAAAAMVAGTLTGCSDEKESVKESSLKALSTSDISAGNGGAKGRYMESEIALPEGAGSPVGMIWKEDQLVLYTAPADEASGYQSYTYTDQTWSSPEEQTWLTDAAQRLYLETDYLYQGMDGKLYGMALSNNEEVPYGHHIVTPSEDLASALDITPEPLLKVSEKGYTELLEDMTVLADGTIGVGTAEGVEFYKDGKNVESVQAIRASTDHQTMLCASRESIAVLGEDGESIDFYHGEDMKKQNQVAMKQDMGGAMLAPGKQGVWYVANKKGIHRVTEDGSIVETIMDGSNGIMGAQAVFRWFVVGKEDEFYGIYKNSGSFRLMRYAFDSEVPMVQSSALNIYGLKENPTVMQAVYEFQSAHPEMKVEYHSAVGPYEAPSSDDIRNLNAELLNGNGADVLILDGLPVESYMKKGILSDISDLQKELAGRGVLENVTNNAVQMEGKVYGIPTRVNIPILFGTEEEKTACLNLENLHNYVQQNPSGMLFGKTTHDLIGMTLFHAMYDELLKENGNLDEQKLTQLLTDWMQICDSSDTRSFEESQQIENGFWSKVSASLFSGSFFEGSQYATMIELAGLSDTMVPYEIMKQKDQTPQGIKNYYVPKGIAGINASSSQQEAAKEFITTLFSETIQKQDNYDGFPVLKQALEYFAEYVDSEEAREMTVATSQKNLETGEETIVNAGFPTGAEIEKLISLLESLDTPFLADRVVTETVMNEMDQCYAGTLNPEETAKAICQKIDTYLAE